MLQGLRKSHSRSHFPPWKSICVPDLRTKMKFGFLPKTKNIMVKKILYTLENAARIKELIESHENSVQEPDLWTVMKNFVFLFCVFSILFFSFIKCRLSWWVFNEMFLLFRTISILYLINVLPFFDRKFISASTFWKYCPHILVVHSQHRFKNKYENMSHSRAPLPNEFCFCFSKQF